jgi:altronate hydrolase
MPDTIDFDCGAVVSGEVTLETIGEQILDLVIATASGRVITAAERLGQWDFIPWKRGVSL